MRVRWEVQGESRGGTRRVTGHALGWGRGSIHRRLGALLCLSLGTSNQPWHRKTRLLGDKDSGEGCCSR